MWSLLLPRARRALGRATAPMSAVSRPRTIRASWDCQPPNLGNATNATPRAGRTHPAGANSYRQTHGRRTNAACCTRATGTVRLRLLHRPHLQSSARHPRDATTAVDTRRPSTPPLASPSWPPISASSATRGTRAMRPRGAHTGTMAGLITAALSTSARATASSHRRLHLRKRLAAAHRSLLRHRRLTHALPSHRVTTRAARRPMTSAGSASLQHDRISASSVQHTATTPLDGASTVRTTHGALTAVACCTRAVVGAHRRRPLLRHVIGRLAAIQTVERILGHSFSPSTICHCHKPTSVSTASRTTCSTRPIGAPTAKTIHGRPIGAAFYISVAVGRIIASTRLHHCHHLHRHHCLHRLHRRPRRPRRHLLRPA